VIEGVDGRKAASGEGSVQLRQLLLTHSMPRSVGTQTRESLDGLTGRGLRNPQGEQVLELIIQEYPGGLEVAAAGRVPCNGALSREGAERSTWKERAGARETRDDVRSSGTCAFDRAPASARSVES